MQDAELTQQPCHIVVPACPHRLYGCSAPTGIQQCEVDDLATLLQFRAFSGKECWQRALSGKVYESIATKTMWSLACQERTEV